MFYYYERMGRSWPRTGGSALFEAEPAPGRRYSIWWRDPVLGRGSFKVTHPGQLKALHGLEVLDASRLPDFPMDAPLSRRLDGGAAHRGEHRPPSWVAVLSQGPSGGRSGVNILAIGDVGSTLPHRAGSCWAGM